MGKEKRRLSTESIEPKIQRRSLILEVQSQVFELNADQLEQEFIQHVQSRNSHAEYTIKLEGVDVETFKIFKGFIEGGHLDVDISKLCLLFTFSRTFRSKKLENACIQKLQSKINVRDVFWILDHAILNNNPDLINHCKQYISINLGVLIRHPRFCYLRPEDLVDVLRLDRQGDISEVNIFDVVVDWSVHECNRRNIEVTQHNQNQILIGVMNHIQFPRMRFTDFTRKVLSSGLVSQGIVTNALCHFLAQHVTLNVNLREAIYLHRPGMYVGRFRGINSGKDYVRSRKDAIMFKVRADVRLSVIQVFGSHQRQGTYRISLYVIDCDDERGEVTLYRKNMSLSTDGRTRIYDITVDPPVPLSCNRRYSVSMLMEGISSYYGVGGQSHVSTNAISMDFFTDLNGLNGTNVGMGQFPGFRFEYRCCK